MSRTGFTEESGDTNQNHMREGDHIRIEWLVARHLKFLSAGSYLISFIPLITSSSTRGWSGRKSAGELLMKILSQSDSPSYASLTSASLILSWYSFSFATASLLILNWHESTVYHVERICNPKTQPPVQRDDFFMWHPRSGKKGGRLAHLKPFCLPNLSLSIHMTG